MQLHEYQEFCIQHIKEHPFCGIFLEPGLGKTIITLTAISDMLLTGDITGKVLVIAPLAVCRNVWPVEASKWDHVSRLRVSLAVGSAADRLAALKADADVYVINRENVPWLVELYQSSWLFDMVVIDELSSFKSNAAKRFKALRHVRPMICRVIGLTGTPAPNSLIDLWPQMYLLDQGARLEKFIGRYRAKYFYPAKTSGAVVWEYGIKAGAADEIYNRIGDICISMRAADKLSLPKRTDNIMPVCLCEAQKGVYDAMRRKMVVEYQGKNITAAGAAVVAGKLLQITGGACYTDGEQWVDIGQEKINALTGLTDDMQGEPLLVYYWYRHEAARLAKAFPDAVMFTGAADQVEAWNAGRVRLMFAHPQSAGHGLNLQAGGHTVCWYTLTWSLEYYMQANARIDRQGQTKPVVVHHLISPGTIDERVLAVLRGKADMQDVLLQVLKAD